MKILAVVQARMGSKRLPGKVMLNIENKPMIGHIYDRLKKVKYLYDIVLATTKDKKNDILVSYSLNKSIKVYRHQEEDDLIGRLYEVVKLFKAEAVLKVNADCPLIDPKIINEGVLKYLKSKKVIDILTNKTSSSFPLGYSYELINTKTINWCQFHLKSKIDRELAVSWIIKNKNIFPNQVEHKNKLGYGEYNLCVDTASDFEKVKNIYKRLYSNNNYFGLTEVMQLLKN